MKKQYRNIALSFAAMLVLGAACSGGPADGPAEVTIQAINGAPASDVPTLTRGDDVDPSTPGVQVSIRLSAPEVPAFTTVWLRVGDQRVEGSMTDSRELEFPGVTLQPGVNQVEAGCDGCLPDQRSIALNAPSLDLQDFVRHPITCLGHDEDLSQEGIQHEFLVRALQFPDGSIAKVRVGEVQHNAEIIDGEGWVSATLPARSGEYELLAEASVGGESITASGTIIVHCPSCSVTHAAQVAVEDLLTVGSAVVLTEQHDTSADPGFQTELVVDSGGLPGTLVELWVGGAKLAEAQQADSGKATFTVSLPEGPSMVQARCRYDVLADTDGRSLQMQVDISAPAEIDDLACSRDGTVFLCRWTAPADPGSSDAVHAWELAFTVDAELDESSFASATTVDSFPPPAGPGQMTQVMFSIPAQQAGQISFAMKSWDRAGHASPLSNVVELSLQ